MNIRLLCTMKYHCTANLLFDWIGLRQPIESATNVYIAIQLNPKQTFSDTYFLLQSKLVFSSRSLISARTTDSDLSCTRIGNNYLTILKAESITNLGYCNHSYPWNKKFPVPKKKKQLKYWFDCIQCDQIGEFIGLWATF